MPKYNVDEQTQLAEPIEITLEGKVYIVGKITTELLNKVTELAKKKDDLNTVIEQFALLTNADPKEFEGIDLRKIGKALEFITTTVTQGLEKPKNS